MFDGVARRYDITNTVLSVGQDRYWRRATRLALGIGAGEKVLDLAAGTAVSTVELATSGAWCVAADFSVGMLGAGRARMVPKVAGDATRLPFGDNVFDAVTISFGLRNVADRGQALREFRRVLRPGGRLMVLDFSTPNSKMLKVVHDLFYFGLMPAVGWAFAWHRDAHHYTSDSIRTWLSRDELSKTMLEAGFVDARYISLRTGFATVHFGVRAAN